MVIQDPVPGVPGGIPIIASEFPLLPESNFHRGLSERPSWDDYFLTIAEAVSTRATCPRRAVGAVLTKDKRILATGFNGSPPGLPHCSEDGCWIEDGHCVRVIHAEHNAVLQGARYGISLEGAECYCTTLPCLGCAKSLVSVGVKRVVYSSDYNPDPRVLELGIILEYKAPS
jgi:dCMP deaminase